MKNKHTAGILYISNHVSFLDILCLGSLLDAKFIAKKEVSKMGLFGILAILNDTFFIDNTNQRKSIEYNCQIQKKLLLQYKHTDKVQTPIYTLVSQFEDNLD